MHVATFYRLMKMSIELLKIVKNTGMLKIQKQTNARVGFLVSKNLPTKINTMKTVLLEYQLVLLSLSPRVAYFWSL